MYLNNSLFNSLLSVFLVPISSSYPNIILNFNHLSNFQLVYYITCSSMLSEGSKIIHPFFLKQEELLLFSCPLTFCILSIACYGNQTLCHVYSFQASPLVSQQLFIFYNHFSYLWINHKYLNKPFHLCYFFKICCSIVAFEMQFSILYSYCY